MLSVMTIMKLLFPFAFLLFPLTSSFGYRESQVEDLIRVPSISVGLCSMLINGKSFAICCKASFLDNALVKLNGPEGSFLPYNLPVNYVSNNSLSLLCSSESAGNITVSCSVTEFESLYLVNFSSFDQTLHLGDWSCETYIVSAKMTVSSRDVITRNDGLVETQENQTVQLLWSVTPSYIVTNPTNEVLVNVSYGVLCNKSGRVEFVTSNVTEKTGIKLSNTLTSDAGTYVLQTSDGVRVALSLQVQVKPTKPKVIYRNLHIEGNPKVASAILYCWSESESKGPMMYEKRVVYRWKGLTSLGGLQVEPYGSGVQVRNVNCTKVTSNPISCTAEQYGLRSETAWIIPQSLCSMSESGDDVYNYLTTSAPNLELAYGITIPLLGLSWIFVVVYIWYLCRRSSHSHRCTSCECSCPRQCCHVTQNCCQAIRNKFTVLYQALRGCCHSTVAFIQYGHRRRERNQNEENNSVPDTSFDDIAVEVADQAGALSQPAAYQTNHQQADGNQQNAIHGVVNQSADGNQQNAIHGVVNQSADGIEEGAIGGAAVSSISIEVERRYQYLIEARSNVNRLHSTLKHPPHMIRVRRSQIVADVLSQFEDSSTGTHQISTRFIGEDGVDGGGLTREMLTLFWNKAKELYFYGNEAFVPYLRPERLSEKKDFITLGRIFSLSVATLTSFPIQMCKSTLMVIIYNTCEINADTLLQDFFLFLDSQDRVLLQLSLNNFEILGEEEIDKLQEFFIKFGMGIVPRASTLRQNVINLAHNELCIKPKFFCENMRQGIPHRHMKQYWMHMTLEHLDHLYEDFLVTAQNVWQKIRCETWPLRNPNEKRVYGYLRDFMQDIEEKTLLSFVQFVTAESKIPSSFITVGFLNTQGIARCPVASTCAHKLDIPVSYSSFEEFKEEFMKILDSDEAKTFSRQ